MTPEQYQLRLDVAGGRCAICQKVRKLSIDHHHASGQVRDLLCHRCNILIGMAGEDPEVLTRAITYLTEWAAERP